jgi:hypothetical protein
MFSVHGSPPVIHISLALGEATSNRRFLQHALRLGKLLNAAKACALIKAQNERQRVSLFDTNLVQLG